MSKSRSHESTGRVALIFSGRNVSLVTPALESRSLVDRFSSLVT